MQIVTPQKGLIFFFTFCVQYIVPTTLCRLHQQMAGRSSRTIYVGNLPLDVKEWEIEDLFYKVCVMQTFLYFVYF